MENNQHSNSGSSTSNNNAATSFSNEQPGQQLPAENSKNVVDNASPAGNEQHSESSKPESGNETLGTP